MLLGNRSAGGWLWDFANGFGFAAFAGLIYLGIQGTQRQLQQIHKLFSYAVTTLLAAHIVLLLLSDSIVIEYLLPGAPLFMWAGTLALLMLAFIVLSAAPALRKNSYTDLTAFRRWHKPLSWLLIVCAGYHIVGSQFYIRHPVQWLALALLLLPLLLPASRKRSLALTAYSPWLFLMLGLASAGLLTLVLNGPAS